MAKSSGIAPMPRKSAAAQEIVACAIPGEPVAAPDGLSPEQKKDWQDLVGNLSNWFSAHDKPLLIELVRHQAIARKIAEELSAMRRQCLNVATPHVSKQRTIFIRLVRVAAQETEVISKLCTRLRLTPQSQQRSRDAGIARERAPSGQRPWDGWQCDESTGQN
jgi:hypothetical protein